MDRDALGSRHSWRCRYSKGHCCSGYHAEKAEWPRAHVFFSAKSELPVRPNHVHLPTRQDAQPPVPWRQITGTRDSEFAVRPGQFAKMPGKSRGKCLSFSVLSSPLAASHSLGESALHESMSAKTPGTGEGGERMDNDGAKQ